MREDSNERLNFKGFRYSRQAERVFLFYATIGMAILWVGLSIFGD